jgi:type VI secretion system secreted protein Hcp
MNTTVSRSLFGAALVWLAAPAGAIAQGGPGINLTIEGTKQGVFPGAKGGAIAALQFSYGVKSPRDAATGQTSAKRQHGPIVVTKMVGTASPQIFQALTSNEPLKSVVVDLPGGEGGIGYTIKLTNASISEIKQYTEVLNGRATVLEDVSFTFQKIEVQDPGTKTMAMDDWTMGK